MLLYSAVSYRSFVWSKPVVIPISVLQMVLQFHGSMKYEKLHPLQSGLFRRKLRTTRRYGLPLESPLVFYPRRLWEILSAYLPFAWYWLRMQLLRKRIQNDPRAKEYTDLAITPVVEAEAEELELFAETGGGKAAVAKAKAKAAARRRHAARAAAASPGGTYGIFDRPFAIVEAVQFDPANRFAE